MDHLDVPTTVPEPLKLGQLYCGLFSRGDYRFHWSLLIGEDDGTMATKIHARDPAGSFEYHIGSQPTKNSMTLCCVVHIGRVPDGGVNTLDRILREIPMEVPAWLQSTEPKFSCRVWFKEALRVLGSHNIITCPDIPRCEDELRTYALSNDDNCVRGLPYTTFISTTCW